MKPPVAARHPHRLEIHGHVRQDDWFWLNQREAPEVVAHLEAENAYFEQVLAHTKPLQAKLFEEIRTRIPQDDQSVPAKLRDWWYSTRHEDGKAYPIHCRRRSADATDEVILDVNVLAEGLDYCEVGARTVGVNQDLMAYAIDTVGRRLYTVRFRDLGTGIDRPEQIEGTSGDIVWAEDGKTLFYTRKDPQTLRPDRVFRHTLGTDPAQDVCVFHEADETYYVGLGKSTSREYLMIGCDTTLRSEMRFVSAQRPYEDWQVFLPREGEHEYGIDHFAGSWWINTNRADDGSKCRNFRLLRAPEHERSRTEEVIPHRDDVLFSGVILFDRHLVTVEREEGLRVMRVLDHAGRELRRLHFAEPVYDAGSDVNAEPDLPYVRVHYSSMSTPPSTLSFDLATGERTVLKEQSVGGGFERTNYVTERKWVTARDGERVPVSIVRHRDTPVDGSAPCVLYGYGSYGISLDANFSPSRLSLLDRGWVWATAHIRGGSELGRRWYENGRQHAKWNTFHDFIDCGEALIESGHAKRTALFCWGGSAGGLLLGCVLNERPDLFAGAISQVPFVDIVTTMLDESIPLTAGEYDEWGNPHLKEFYDLMLSYSPYDNVKAQDYPDIMVMTGLHDSQVQYWEPAKWVAKLRSTMTNDALVILRTDMSSGHGGASGRYDRYREVAMQYAFLLDRVGWREPGSAR